MANKLSAKPEKEAVFKSLTKLYNSAKKNNKRVCSLVIDPSKDKFIIFSDQHKGNRDWGDDFANNEFNYLKALNIIVNKTSLLSTWAIVKNYGNINLNRSYPTMKKPLQPKPAFNPTIILKHSATTT
jgi:hypothetical protein